MNVAVTRGTLLNSGDAIPGGKLTLYGWQNGEKLMEGTIATYSTSSGKWSLPTNYILEKETKYTFLSYANVPTGGATVTPPTSSTGIITLEVTDITAAQQDVLLGRCEVSNPESGEINIDFSHPYASVVFQLGNADGVKKVTAVALDGVYRSGKTTFRQSSAADGKGVVQYTWTEQGNANASLSETGLSKEAGDDLVSFLVIPQNLQDKNAVVTVTYIDDTPSAKEGHMVKLLNDGSWIAGYTTTYTLNKIGDVNISITDAITPKNSGYTKIYVRATITGAWYKDGMIVAPWHISEGTFEKLPGSGWTEDAGIYYYGTPLESESRTSALFTGYTPAAAPVAGATLKLNILVQAIPYDVNKTCQEAFEAL